MNRSILILCALNLGLISPALAAATKTYQVSGPILEVKDDMLVVQKGKEHWEIARNSDSKVPAGLKSGDKVTIQYRMTATSVEDKSKK